MRLRCSATRQALSSSEQSKNTGMLTKGLVHTSSAFSPTTGACSPAHASTAMPSPRFWISPAYTGSVGLNAIVNDLLGSLVTAVAIIFALLVFLFGSWRLGLLSIPPNVIPLVGTMAWMSWRGINLNAATVIVFSISVWSIMTAASGLARSFAHLALARVGVGIGEAGGTPPSRSCTPGCGEMPRWGNCP